MEAKHYRARVAHFRSGFASKAEAFEYIDDAILSLENGRVQQLVPASEAFKQGLDPSTVIDKQGALIFPGLIDAHVHAPQLNIIGSYGEQLLEWLNTYTFPAESAFASVEYALEKNRQFLHSLLRHGTTTAVVFSTSHRHACAQLFELALEKKMRIIAGKVLMNRNAPAALNDHETGIADTRKLIEQYHQRGRLGYAVTPRFAGTSTPEQLQRAGQLVDDYPGLWVHTHLSENKAEIDWTLGLFPEASDYLDCYERYGLHTAKSIFAHCIHLTDSERQRIADMGSTVAFCPSSNLFLGSGLLNLKQLQAMGIHYAPGSDVGAGTSLSMFRTLADAYKVTQLQQHSYSSLEALYDVTLGAATSLRLDQYIGNFEKGKEADFIVLDARSHRCLSTRVSHCRTIQEELFAYITMADDRLVQETHTMGECVYTQQGNRH